jgi:hypothetical protein
MGMIEYLLVEVIFALAGRCYLHLRYRDRETIQRIKEEKYLGEFSNAGRIVLINIFAGLFGLLLVGGLIAGIIGIIRHDILK